MLQKTVAIARRNAGFTLTEMMVALGIVGMIVGGVSLLITGTQSQVNVTQAIAERDAYARRIEKALANPKTVLYSAMNDPTAGNLNLLYCVKLNSGGQCNATAAGAPQTFNLYEARGTPLKISGTAAAPVDVDPKGSPNCTTSAGCPLWKVTTYFYATCPSNTATCDHATSVQLAYQIVPTVPRYLGKDLSPYPPAPTYKAVSVDHIQTQSCPANSYLAGYTAGGTIECKCTNGIVNPTIGTDGLPVCPGIDKICNPGQLLHGRKSDGTPICLNTVRICPGLTDFGDKDATCPNGGWLEGLNLGTCNTQGGGGKKGGGSQVVKCASNQGRCCYYEPIP